MSDRRLEQIVESLFMIIPLLRRKLPKAEPFIGKSVLNPSHHQILFMLDDLGEQSISYTVKALGITKTNITPLVEKLVSEGLICRQTDPSDRRYIRIDLTIDGRKYIEKVKMQLAIDLKERLTPLGDADLDTLMVSLQNVKGIIEKI